LQLISKRNYGFRKYINFNFAWIGRFHQGNYIVAEGGRYAVGNNLNLRLSLPENVILK
jgi:hypothetical protein